MPSKPPDRPLRRKDAFLGVHFDLHARKELTGFGAGVSEEMVRRILEKVRPDWVQCDCKGHPGIASYPTEVGTSVGQFARDPLRIWRDVTAAHGVGLYVHYSGVVDHQAVEDHPDWGALDAEGNPLPGITSVFGPYADRLMIPQFLELCRRYEVDGFWVDGECWGVWPDYSEHALRAWREQTGKDDAPRSPEDGDYRRFRDFCREGFRRYLRHYTAAVHAEFPAVQIGSAWGFSLFMPEPVSADVDYLSGDFSNLDSVNSARVHGRILAGQGKPWDLMAWGFALHWGEGDRATKTAIQLQREAACVLSLGGAFQVYLRQQEDGSIHDWEMDLMAEVARFCRRRQPWCRGARPLEQLLVLLATGPAYGRMSKLFSPKGGAMNNLRGIVRALLESQLSVEIGVEGNVIDRLDRPLVVVPEWRWPEASTVDALMHYVEAGGSLLIVGARAAEAFAGALGVELRETADPGRRWLHHEGHLAPVDPVDRLVGEVDGDVEAMGSLHTADDPRSDASVAATLRPLGRGRIAAIYFDLGDRCLTAATPTLRRFLADTCGRLFEPVVRVAGSMFVDVHATRRDGRLFVHLVNTAGPHDSGKCHVHDEIPPVGPLAVRVRTGSPPRSVQLQPGDRAVEWSAEPGAAVVRIPRLEIHDIVVVDGWSTPSGETTREL